MRGKSTTAICYDRAMNTTRRIVQLIVALAAGLAPAVAAAAPADADPPVATVSAIDLARYAGLWHEVAKIPNRFQKQCAHGATAEYSLREDGRITVVNRCVKEDGSGAQARGIAKVVDTDTHAKLKVSFVSFLGWRPFWGDYWVIGLDDEYRWAVIGTPDRKYGWILARTPTLDAETMETIYAILETNGYKRESFEISPP